MEIRIDTIQSCNGELSHISEILQNKLALIHYNIKENINKNLDFKEQKAVERI